METGSATVSLFAPPGGLKSLPLVNWVCQSTHGSAVTDRQHYPGGIGIYFGEHF